MDQYSSVHRVESFRKIGKALRKDWMLYVLLLPMVIWFALWVYKPMAGLLIAFQDFSPALGVKGSPLVGLERFIDIMFGTTYGAEFWRAFRNTFVLSLYGLVFGFPIPIILAILFSEIGNKTYRNITQTITYLPHFLSEVTIISISFMLVANSTLSVGVVTRLLAATPFFDSTLNLMNEAKYFRPLYQIIGIWKEAGYGSIVYFAAIMGVSPTLYEALKVDGGNKLQEIRYVTLPGISSTLIIMIILRIGKMLSVGYERIILLTGGNSQTPNTNLYETAEVLSSFVYRIGFGEGGESYGAAAGMFNSLIAFALVISANLISKKMSKTSLW